jgi:exportin-7
VDCTDCSYVNSRLNVPGQLTWLVYIIGAAIGGRMPFNNIHEHESMDSELVCRVLQLMNLTDARLARVRFDLFYPYYIHVIDRNKYFKLSHRIHKKALDHLLCKYIPYVEQIRGRVSMWCF